MPAVQQPFWMLTSTLSSFDVQNRRSGSVTSLTNAHLLLCYPRLYHAYARFAPCRTALAGMALGAATDADEGVRNRGVRLVANKLYGNQDAPELTAQVSVMR